MVLLLLSLVNCQKEDTHNEPAANQVQNPKALNVTISNWQHFSEKNPGASQRIKAVQEQNALARNTESELYGFVIDTSRVQIIEQEGFTTYAFTAIRQQPIAGIMENYLYKQNNDGTYQQYLLGYYCTVDEDGNIQYTAEDLLITPIDDPSLLSRDSCYPEFVQVGENTVCTASSVCFGSNSDGRHTTSIECQCEEQGISNCFEPGTVSCRDVPVFGWSNCPGGLPEENPFDPSNPSNSGGTPTTTYTAPDGIVYTILEPHPALYEVLTCINGSNGQASLNDPTTLNVDAQMIATMNAYWKPMSIYLQENACSPEAQAFSIAVANAEPVVEVDYVNEIIYDIDQKCAKEVVMEVLNNSSELSQNILAYFNQDRNYIIKYKNDNLPTNIIAKTDLMSSCFNNICTINVTLSNLMLNGSTDLFVAKIALHETIHASLTYLFETNQFLDQGLDPNSSQNPNYAELIDAYIAFLAMENPNQIIANNINDLQHEYMTIFVDDMIESLTTIGLSLGYSNNSPSMQNSYLKQLVWSGSFESTYGFVQTFDINEQEQVIALGKAELLNIPMIYPIYDANGNQISTTIIAPVSNQINNSNTPCF
uniref:hypothetical protein n=1 Tax=Gelidibacter sp. TaxID=2018083 RepID=UPI004049F1AD